MKKIKNKSKIGSKSLIAIGIVLAMVLSIIPFKVFANNESYTITFTASDGHNIVGSFDNNEVQKAGEIIIDGQMVVVQNNNGPVGNVTVSADGKSATIEIADGSETSINYGGTDAFTLYVAGQPHNMDAKFNESTNVAIQNHESGNHGGQGTSGGQSGQESSNISLIFDSASVSNEVITFHVDQSTEVVGTISGDGATLDNGQWTVDMQQVNNVKISLDNNFDKDNMSVIVRGNNSYNDKMPVNGDNEATFTGLNLPGGGLHIAIERNQGNQQGGEEHHNPAVFDGNAYFVWLNKDNKICYHKFTNLLGAIPNNGHMEYYMNYVHISELTDQSGNNSNFTGDSDESNWVLAVDLEDGEGNIIPENLNKLYIFGDGIPSEDRRKEMGVQLDPCGGENGANSLSSNADRNFRVLIYRDGYEAISFSSSEEDYTYFPRFWDPSFFSSTVDISGTSKDKPAVYNTYLIEPTVKFTTGQFSAEQITAVEALDVNPNAVSITKVDGIFTVKFNSNYYDHVVFKVTAGEKTYYIQLNRIVTDVHDNFGPGVTDTKIIAELYYPTNKSYNDFEVFATVVNKDGTEETSIVSVNKYESEDYQNVIDNRVDDYVQNGGKGLYCSQYSIPVDKEKAVGVYFTVINKGALSGDNYGGTYAGSGRGTYYDIESRDIVL